MKSNGFSNIISIFSDNLLLLKLIFVIDTGKINGPISINLLFDKFTSFKYFNFPICNDNISVNLLFDKFNFTKFSNLNISKWYSSC